MIDELAKISEKSFNEILDAHEKRAFQRGLDAAIKIICEFCREGVPVHDNADDYVEGGPVWVLEPHWRFQHKIIFPIYPQGKWLECKSSSLRALKLKQPDTFREPPIILAPRVLLVVAKWKAERDAKCENCKNGLGLGAHGCHFDREYSVGNCKAWTLSRRIQQIEEACRP